MGAAEPVVEAAAQGPLERGGLVVDLAVQVAAVLAEVVRRQVGLHLRDPLLGVLGGAGEDAAVRVVPVGREALGGQRGHLAVVEVHDRGRVPDQGGEVAGEVHLLLPDAEDERAAEAGHDQPVGEVGVHHGEAVGALDLGERVGNLVLEGLGGRAGHEVGQHLGVGVGGQVDPVLAQSRAQRRGVVEDAVVHDGHAARGVGVRVGVGVGGGAVRGPAGVPDAEATLEAARQVVGEVTHPPGALGQPQRVLAAAEHGDPGRVVAAVLEPGEALEEQRRCLLGTDVPRDPTHLFPFRSPLVRRSAVDDAAHLPLAERRRREHSVRHLTCDDAEDRGVRQAAAVQLAVAPADVVLDGLGMEGEHVLHHAGGLAGRQAGGGGDVAHQRLGRRRCPGHGATVQPRRMQNLVI